jgi:chromosome segregation ATPase
MDNGPGTAELKAQLDGRHREIETLKEQLELRSRELSELRQRLEIRNLSLERLQAQFTIAADAVNKLLTLREQMRLSRWMRLGVFFGFVPDLGDDLK